MHYHRYHVLDHPSLTDAEDDALMVELRGLEERYPELTIISEEEMDALMAGPV